MWQLSSGSVSRTAKSFEQPSACLILPSKLQREIKQRGIFSFLFLLSAIPRLGCYIFLAVQWGCKKITPIRGCMRSTETHIGWPYDLDACFVLHCYYEIPCIHCFSPTSFIHAQYFLFLLHEADMKQSERIWRKEFRQRICWQCYVRTLSILHVISPLQFYLQNIYRTTV